MRKLKAEVKRVKDEEYQKTDIAQCTMPMTNASADGVAWADGSTA